MNLDDQFMYGEFEKKLPNLPPFYNQFKDKIAKTAREKNLKIDKQKTRVSIGSIIVATARTVILEEGNMAVPYAVICRDFGVLEDKKKINLAHEAMGDNMRMPPSHKSYLEFCVDYLELNEEKEKALKKEYRNNKQHYERTPNPGTFLKELLTEMRFAPDEIAKVTGVKLESIIYQSSVRKMKPYFL